jgi:hypothetical protein
MTDFDFLPTFERMSIDRDGYVEVTSIKDDVGRIKQGVDGYVFQPFDDYVLCAEDLICIAVWLNQLNGVTFDVSMLA